uniref:Laminin subunit alpha n=1 Tax=Lygus hesperus TaxID=30085 RepID=A0A146LZT3_LYGHE
MQLSTFTMLPSYVWFFAIAFPNPGYSQGETENEYIDFASTEANPNNDESHLVGRSFALLEKRIHSYIDYGRRWQMAVISNKSRFLEEVDEYLTRLPRNATKMVISSSRDVCHCEGRRMTPCPIRCLYSCYVKNTDSYTINNGWRHEDDCRGIQMHDCRCHEHSSTSCYENQLLNCFNQTTDYVQADKSCKQYSVNKPNLVRSYELILNLLMEPLKMYFRSLESRLSFLKQATFTINSLSNIAGPKCTDFQDSTECTPGIDQLISEEETIYAQMRTNFFLELIKIQSKIQTASMKVEKLKQGTIDSINRSIKGYSCCLKSLDFAIDDYDCSDVTSPYPTQLSVSDSECECDPLGSYEPTCNSEGSCSCRPHFDGKLCNRCEDGFYNHPLCEALTATTEAETAPPTTDVSPRDRCFAVGGRFSCYSGKIINCSWVCDGARDCRYGEDELNC